VTWSRAVAEKILKSLSRSRN